MRHIPKFTMLASVICAALLSACGGGQDPVDQKAMMGGNVSTDDTSAAVTAATETSITPSRTVQGGATLTPLSAGALKLAGGLASAAVSPLPAGSASTVSGVTNVTLTSTAAAPQSNVPVTFGQVFAVGDVRSTETLTAKLGTTTIPLQVDVKARHADGSLRHAVISAVLPSAMPGQKQTLTLVKAATANQSVGASASPSTLLNSGFTSSFTATIGGQPYTASADALLKSGKFTTWLSGSQVTEWEVSAPLKNASGQAHPHLAARFGIRYYPASGSARVDVTVENDWVYEPSPQNFTYDAQFLVGGNSAYSRAGLLHYNHARWRKTAWWGKAPQLDIRHNTAYLIASKAVPNYDQTISIKEATLADLQKSWLASNHDAMGNGLAMAYMPTTGGRIDLGLMPQWSAIYLLSQDPRAREIMLTQADLAGSWSSHYRNPATDRPVTVQDYPYMTIAGNISDTYNPVTKKREAFPDCPATLCSSPMTFDSAHQPGFSYLPYIITGDLYHLEELQFYAQWNSFSSNPVYRGNVQGLVVQGQTRGQGWSMRTLGEAAYITPDADPLKKQFATILSDSLDWYNTNYTNNASANTLGALLHSYALAYDNETAIAPWQDDIFTSAIGHLTELGFDKSKPLLTWKTRFVVDRMTAQGVCWIDASAYNMKVRDTNKSPFYTSMAQVYKATHTDAFNALACNSQQMAYSLKLLVNEMTGYSSSVGGYPTYMQPVLAYAVGARPDGAAAWKLFMSRANKPDYSTGPTFDIVPR